MRLQHAKQVAEALPAGNPHPQPAKAGIVTKVERLRWRTRNGKAKDARIALKRLHTLLPALEREPVREQGALGFGQLFDPTPGAGLHWAEAA